MQTRVWLGGLCALSLGALVIACGDDDDDDNRSTPPPVNGTDGGNVTPGADGGDAATNPSTFAAITPVTTTRLANAFNVYGSTFSSDGFLYASGATMDAGVRKLAVWRLKDGVLDPAFGTGGVAVIGAAVGTSDTSYGIVEVAPGKLVVQVVSGGAVSLVALDATTATFGAPKKIVFGWGDDITGWPNTASTPGPQYSSWGIALDRSNGTRIVVSAAGAPAKAVGGAVQRTDNDRWIARVDATTFDADPTFNGGQAWTADVDGKSLNDNSRRILVLADGSIVQSGYTAFPAGTTNLNSVVIVKLTAAGVADPAFNFGTAAPLAGQAIFNPFASVSGFGEAYGVVAQSTGRLVTTGYGTSHAEVQSKSLDLVSFGLKADGLDATYGKLGSVAIQSEIDPAAGVGTTPFMDRGRDLAVLADDRVVHGGMYDHGATLYVTDPNGALDEGFGNGGMARYAFPGAFFKVTTSADGKLIAATTESLNQTNDAGTPNATGAIIATLRVGE